MRVSQGIAFFIVMGIAGLVLCPADAQQIAMDPPVAGEFIRDNAGLLDTPDKERIASLCASLLSDKAIPIIVVTIEQMSEYGGEGLRIETFATLMYNQWEIGHEELDGKYWNKGILLLISAYDRQARIELGDGWTPEGSAMSRDVMERQIIPHFKRGDYSKGITAGVIALDKMSREGELPRRAPSRQSMVFGLIVMGLGIFTVVSLIRRGRSGWAILFWGAAFSLIGMLIYRSVMNSRGGFGGGGGFSGGSFGGGFSGGGGATGSW